MNNYYNLYIENTYNLAETIVIKFEDAAVAINLKVMANYGVDAVDALNPNDILGDHGVGNINVPSVEHLKKRTWKYYQNISGNYHFSDMFYNTRTGVYDNYITITSLDTAEDIIFRTSTLLEHPVTKKAYLFGNRHYRELVQKYPEQEMLILGILYPCDIDVAISAVDGTILSYPEYLVESNEYTFIIKLQDWIYKYVDRWINKQFAISDDLYVATYIGQLCISLVPAIINLRLQACKTNEAHSFHVREYLASHGMLDKYLGLMTKEQSLFFYRNILYIQRNSGTRDTFEWLVENIMTKRSLPLYDFTMKHDVSNMLISEHNDTLHYCPDIRFRRRAVNPSIATSVDSYVTLDHINTKTEYTAPGNQTYLLEEKDNIRRKFEDSLSNVVGSKLLESSMIDYTDSVPHMFEGILLNHWAYWCNTGKYKAFISIVLPKTKKTIELKARDAFALYIYALNKCAGITLVNIPEVVATRVLLYPTVDIQDLKNIVDSSYVSVDDLNRILSTVPVIGEVLSVDSFYAKCKAIYLSTLKQYAIHCMSESPKARNYLNAAVDRLYADIKVSIYDTGATYTQWLDTHGLNYDDYTDRDFYDLALRIYMESTGVVNNEPVSIKLIQKAMVEMLSLLSSYSIQIVSDIAQPGVILVPRPMVRADIVDRDLGNTENMHNYITAAAIHSHPAACKEEQMIKFDISKVYPIGTMDGRECSVTRISPLNMNVIVKQCTHVLDPVRIPLSNIAVLNAHA